MDNFTIINYQGSKKNLLEFIHNNLDKYINNKDVILDIFSGTAAVAYSYKRTNKIYTNDAEIYATTIAKALLGKKINENDLNNVINEYEKYIYPDERYDEWIKKEKKFTLNNELENLISLYNSIPLVWNDGKKYFKKKNEYSLFVKYYSTNYFGIEQAKDIDALRKSIDKCAEGSKYILLVCLFYAIKECIFSKDGHMAQPLDLSKNRKKLFKLRRKNIFSLFLKKTLDFYKDEFVVSGNKNMSYNMDFESLLKSGVLSKDVNVIYADPPYTDMQYSRYYHILNTVVEYNYPDITINKGKHTKGLYLENRFQSQLSKKSTCLKSMEKLIRYSHEHNILLAISFAYPRDINKQKTDRYVMDINDLIRISEKYYTPQRVIVKTMSYEHSNNRNSETKKVLEYLIICKREGK